MELGGSGYFSRAFCAIESDPLGLAAGVNTYAYVGANPLTLFDPDGLNETKWKKTLPAVAPDGTD
jgi:hypothetical protein